MLLLRNSQYNFNLYITDNSYYDKHGMLQLSDIYIQYWLNIQNEDNVNNIYNYIKEEGLGQQGTRLLIAAEKVNLGKAMYVDFWIDCNMSTFFLNLQKVFLTDKKHGIPQTRYPLWSPMMLPVLLSDTPPLFPQKNHKLSSANHPPKDV